MEQETQGTATSREFTGYHLIWNARKHLSDFSELSGRRGEFLKHIQHEYCEAVPNIL